MKRSHQQGVALIIVLAMLMLLSALLVAFMSSATTELSATQAASAGSTSRQLADTTVNLVIGQLREATTQKDESTTWASQPGAVRTYSGRLASKQSLKGHSGAYYYDYSPGSNDFVYKLYSSDNMKVTSDAYDKQDLPEEVNVIENWESDRPLEYVDLNEPIVKLRLDADPSGKTVEPHYPIIDPRAMFTANGSPSSGGGNPGIVEGFDAKLSFDDEQFLEGSRERLPYLPMPVKWLYVLKDGTVGPATLGTAENPIVGRTAFWVDDESCKLNINTASEGVFWDTPSVSTEQEAGNVDGGNNLTSTPFSLSLASASPVAQEYQRYPGHPSTTCLSPVLGWMWNLAPNMSLYPRHNAAYRVFKDAIYQIAPFTPNGRLTTVGGTANADPFLKEGERPKHSVATKRLYATVDELMFKSSRNTGSATNPKSDLNDFSKMFTPEALEKTRFFLTANSRAPELNLFGKPRVTLWPVHADFRLRTNFDDLFAFTSTIAKTSSEASDKKYFLVRSDSKTDTGDFNAQNEQMYKYLQYLTNKPTPGFGNSLASKYASRDQILTEIFDYVRTVNLVDTGTAAKVGNTFIPYTPPFYPPQTDTYSRRFRSIDWSGQVTPLKVGNTMGMGRFVTISEAALVFHLGPNSNATAKQIQATLLLEMATTMPGYPAIRETYWTKLIGDTGDQLEIGFVTPAGPTSYTPAELCTQSANANDLGLVNIVNVSSHEISDGRGFMPTLGFHAGLWWYPMHKAPTTPEKFEKPWLDPYFNQTNTANPASKTFIYPNMAGTTPAEKYNIGVTNFKWTDTVRNYPYVSKQIPVPAGATAFKFNGPQIKAEIWSGQGPTDGRSRLVQTIYLDFPNVTANLPIPTSNSFAGRLTDGSLGGSWNIIQTGDVVRSIEFTGPQGGNLPLASRGDLRLGAALQVVPKSFYLPRDASFNTYNSSAQQVHGLTKGHADPVNGHTQGLAGNGSLPGRLVPNGTIRTNKPPILPRGVNGVMRIGTGNEVGPGDWDRGISKHMDGAFGNKVDEGNLKFDTGVAAGDSSRLPYFRGRGIEETGQSYFTPNRQMPSAVMLGSLPTGIDPANPDNSKPWQTLLFRPDRETSGNHPGAAKPGVPADHIWLDLFTVPVVEPYAISEPFSTAGKVNMNYVIAPFGYAKGGSGNNTNTQSPRSYLRRDSALRGVLRSVWTMAVPATEPEMAHSEKTVAGRYFRFPIDLDKTIDELEVRLNDQSRNLSGRPMTLFRSASEICDIDLYPRSTVGGPSAPTISNWATYWNQNAATGDNVREKPYADIYPRLTTKSNVYTIHMRCQVIRKSPTSNQNDFDPIRDQVVSEYRGSAMVERFIDPNDHTLVDYNHTVDKAEPYYRYRVLGTKQFVGN